MIKKSLIVLLILIAMISSVSAELTKVGNDRISCSKKCNVVLISIDSLIRRRLGIYGYERNTSPHIDSIAKRSWLFENFFSTGYLTPVSELSVHTGLYPDRSSSREFQDTQKLKTLGDILKAEGYTNYAYGNSPEFEIVKSYKNILKNSFGDNYNIKGRVDNNRQLEWDKINEFLTKNKAKPLFLWFPLGSVHAPFGYALPNKFADNNYQGAFKAIQFYANMQFYYDGKVYDPRKPEHRFNTYFFAGTLSDMHITDKDLSGTFPKKTESADLKYINDLYDNGVAQADYEVGRIIKLLKEHQIFHDTIIILQSEHGETMGERKYIAHSDVYDELVHEPLIIHIPGIAPKVIKEKFVSGIDILPTVMDLLNIKFTDYAQDGKSFVAIKNGKVELNVTRDEVYHVRTPLWESLMAVKNRRSIFDDLRDYQKSTGNDLKEYAIRNKDYKLIHRRARFVEMQYSAWTFISGKRLNIPEYEFYDIRKDPLELSPIKLKGQDFEKLKKKLLHYENGVRSNGIKGGSPLFEIQDYR